MNFLKKQGKALPYEKEEDMLAVRHQNSTGFLRM